MRGRKRTEREDRRATSQEHKAGTGEKRYYRLYDVAALKRY